MVVAHAYLLMSYGKLILSSSFGAFFNQCDVFSDQLCIFVVCSRCCQADFEYKRELDQDRSKSVLHFALIFQVISAL